MASNEEIRAAAQEILSDWRFRRWDEEYESWLRAFEGLLGLIPDPVIQAALWFQETVIRGFLGGLLQALIELFGVFGGFGDPASILGFVGVALILALVIVLVYRIQLEKSEPGWRNPELVALPASHADAIREAQRLADEGRFLDGAHRVQLAILALLIERGWIELARSDPNRTLRARLAASSLPEQERNRLVALVDRLEALWFGEPQEDPSLFASWLALDREIMVVATRGPR